MRLSEAFELYRQEVIIFRNMSKKTEEGNLYAQRSFIRALGDLDVGKLTFLDIRTWSNKQRCSSNTKRNYVISLRMVLKHLQARGITCLNWETIAVPKRESVEMLIPTKEDVIKLFVACERNNNPVNRLRNKLIISVLSGSGLRVSELVSLNRTSIENRQFSVIGKGSKPRPAFITRESEIYIEEYLRLRSDNNPALLVTASGKRMTTGDVREIFYHIGKRAEVYVHPHSLRHYFATSKMERNVHIYDLKRMMGHSNISTTEAYLHRRDKKLFEIFDQTS